MKEMLSNILYRSLLPFIISLLGPWAQKASTNQSTSISTTLPDLDSIQQTDLFTDPAGVVNIIPCDVYTSFLWFIAMVAILEIVALASSLFKEDSPKVFSQHHKSAMDILHRLPKSIKGIVSEIGKFMMSVLKAVCVSSLCYCLSILIIVIISLACNAYISVYQNGKLVLQQQQQGASLDHLSLRNLQGNYPSIIPILVSDSSDGPSLSSLLVAERFEINEASYNTETSALISEDGNTVFIGVVSNVNPNAFDQYTNCSFQILDITNKSSPNFVGEVVFDGNFSGVGPMVLFDEETIFIAVEPLIYIVNVSDLASPQSISTVFCTNGTIGSFSITPDKQTLIIATESGGLQLVNISDLTSLTNISSYHPYQSNLRFFSLLVSADSKTIILGTCDPDLLLYGECYLQILDIMNPQSVKELYVTSVAIRGFNELSDFGSLIYSINLNEDVLYLQNVQSMQILNISTRENPIQMAYFEDLFSEYVATTVTFAPDYSKCYIAYASYALTGLHIFTISNYTSFNLAGKVLSSNIIDIIAPSNNYVYLLEEDSSDIPDSPDNPATLGIIDVSEPTSPRVLPDITDIGNSIETIYSVSSDGRTVFGHGDGVLLLFHLNIDISSSQPFFFLNDPFATIVPSNNSGQISAITLSPNGEKLFVVAGSDAGSDCLIFNVSNPYSYVQLSSFQVSEGSVEQIKVSPDGKILFVVFSRGMLAYDLESFQSIPALNMSQNDQFSLSISPDGNIIYLIDDSLEIQNLVVLDIANQSNTHVIANVTLYQYTTETMILTLSNNGNTVFIGGTQLLIYNVTIPSSPIFLANFTDISGTITGVTLSPADDVAFVLVVNSAGAGQCELMMIDISSLTTPVFITSIDFPWFETGIDLLLAQTSPTTQILFIPLDVNLAAVDVSLPASPKLLSFSVAVLTSIAISPDNSTMFLANSEMVSIKSVNANHILYLDSTNVSLGAPYSNTLSVLTKNAHNTYDAYLTGYQFTNMAFYVETILGPEYPTLPGWIEFDEVSGSITFSPDSQSSIGNYYLYGTISTQIPKDIFKGVGSINTTSDSLSLLVSLISLGYVNNEFFLTSSFNPSQSLVLPLQYIDDEPQLRSKLASYYLRAMTMISVSQSLELIQPDFNSSSSTVRSMSVATNSSSPINMLIALFHNNSQQQLLQPKFVSTAYSFVASYSNNNSAISMEGSLLDVNNALSQLIVYLDDLDSCDGNITIIDSLNPTLSQVVPSISQYFKVSSQPWINTTYFQNQLSKISPETGDQFFIQFDSSTFVDINNQPLEFSIEMQQSNVQVPDWLELKDLTLTGIPPMQLTGREIDLMLVVSNQYQSSAANFTLEVSISLDYTLQMLFKYGGILITVIGLIAYASHIYNIFGKRSYRYPKDFVIRTGQEINPKTFYPIAFGAGPLLESRIIMADIDHKIARELNDKTKARIAAYFTSSHGSCQLDRAKLIKTIEQVTTEISSNDKTKLKLYTPLTTSQKDLINQLIINNFIVRLLDLKEEETTKRVFDEIKQSMFSFIELERCLLDGVCIFSVNRAKLYSKLQSLNIKVFAPSDSKEEGETVNSSVSERDFSEDNIEQSDSQSPFINEKSFGLNEDLLVNAIEAYAFNNHIIDAYLIESNIVVRKRLDNVWRILDGVRRFLKIDLQALGMNGKALVSFGIIDRIQERSIEFYGTANNEIKDQTLVLQIVNLKGRILRELWIYGVDASPEKEVLSEEVL